MAATLQGKTPSKNATKQPRSEDSASLLFRMVDGVQPVLQLQRRSTNTENRRTAVWMVKVDLGPIKCITSKVKEHSVVVPTASDHKIKHILCKTSGERKK